MRGDILCGSLGRRCCTSLVEMESKAQDVSVIQLPSPDSLSVKEYAPSFSSEPPPAYQKPRSTAVQVARIAGLTLVAASVILGTFLLAAAWVNTRYSCSQHVVVPASDAQNHESLPSFDRLIDSPKEKKEVKESEKKRTEKEETKEMPIRLQLDFDELAGALMEHNMRSQMKCIVEKKQAEEIVDHLSHTLQLPFGLNLTSEPRQERVTGERLAIFCESGQHPKKDIPFEIFPMNPEQHLNQDGPLVLPGPIHLPFQFIGPLEQPQLPLHPFSQHIPNQQLPHHGMQHHHLDAQHISPETQHQIHQEMQHQQMAEMLRHGIMHPQQQPIHLQLPHNEGAHVQVPVTHPQHAINIFTPIQQGSNLQQIQQKHRQEEILRHQLLEQEELEKMRPPPLPVPSSHQLPPLQSHHLVAHGPFVMELTEINPEQTPDTAPLSQRLPFHPSQENIHRPEDKGEHRPHYVQPRSVPSEFHLKDKRLKKRCACDCSC